MQTARLITAAAATSLLVFALTGAPVAAADFRAVTDAAILYDAPAVRGKKLYVAPRGMPVEVVVSNEGWARVRDKSGELAWIERKFLSEKRTVIANAPAVVVREQASDNARVVITVAQDVVLELVDPPSSGWAKVKHRDGATGFVAIGQVWGL
jgi:SH3-like domain-containing protein